MRNGPRRRTHSLFVAGLVLLGLLVPLTPASAAPLFSDGFEAGNLSAWTSVTGAVVAVNDGSAFAGSWYGRATSTGTSAYLQKNLASAQSEIYFQSAVNVIAPPTGLTAATLLRLTTASGGQIVSLKLNKSLHLQIKNHVSGTTLTSATTLPVGGWRVLQLHALVNGLSSLVEVWLDGSKVTDLTTSSSLGITAVGSLQLGTKGTSGGYTLGFDEVVADTAFIGGGPPPPPATPTNLHTTLVTSSQVSLAWDPVSGADGYGVYRDGIKLGPDIASTAFNDTTVQPSTQYTYTVDAFIGTVRSAQTPGLVVMTPASGSATCGVSSTHTICITLPSTTLMGEQTITVTNSPNSDLVFFDWHPASGSIRLMEDFAPSPETGDYSFVWPTEKYLDATGTLEVRAVSAAATPVSVTLTLSNLNTTDFKHFTGTDCSNGCPPAPWTGIADPVIAAVGDGPSDETSSNAVADSIVAANPPLFLFLGDIYDTGTFTENLNHYGVSSLDSASSTLWGRLATITQPAVGNHEAANLTAWMDYFHGHPDLSSFTFGGVLFIDVNSSKSFSVGSQQYNFVQSLVAPPATPPACIVAFWHIPALNKSTVDLSKLPMWQLLSDNGGDLVLNGHIHSMIQYSPLDRNLALGAGAHMVQLVAGSGGHSLGGSPTDPRIQFSKGKTGGALYLTLVGANNGGTATSITWNFKQASNGTVLHSGSVSC